jgi:tripartite-type tricarboxylate transporter receptor subunit TctC
MASQPVLLMVGKNNPAHNVAEFIDYAKKKNGGMTFGSSGEGSAVHLAMELLCNAAGIQMIHVPYKGINPALMDVLGGRIDTVLLSYQGAGDHIKTGELRPLAVSSLQRSKLSPDLPTLAETYPGFEVTLWYGLSAPKGVPQATVDKWNKAVKQALQDPDLAKWLTDANTTPIGSTTAQADEFLKKEYARWIKAVEAARSAPKSMPTRG